MVVYMPVYRTYRAKRTLEQRRAELTGFVNILFNPGDLFVELGAPGDRNSLKFQVHDAGPTDAPALAPTADNLMYSTFNNGDVPRHEPGLDRSRLVSIAGRHWLIRFDNDAGSPLLIVERRCFLADDRPVEFTETRYNGESYDFLTELRA